MQIRNDNNPQDVIDRHFTVKCPHCQVKSNLTAVAIPRYELLQRFRPRTVGIAYRCDSCNEPVFLRVPIIKIPSMGHPIDLGISFEEVERAEESFELQYLPGEVAADFEEALKSYSSSCFNAFAAMCRRTIQTASMELGADGTTKVQNQLNDLRAMGVIDDETFLQLREIMLAGHDGTHPHLPKLSPERANVLLELMKDVLYQLFVRQAKIRESTELRQKTIEEKSRGQ
jgi:Domain of unknown function (DUF4145)